MLVATVNELTTGDVIGDLLGLPELSGKRPLSRCHHLEHKCVGVLPLGRVAIGQMLSHGVPLVFRTDLLLMRFNSRMCTESGFAAIPFITNIADPGVVCTSSEVTRPYIRHPAVGKETSGEVRFGQE